MQSEKNTNQLAIAHNVISRKFVIVQPIDKVIHFYEAWTHLDKERKVKTIIWNEYAEEARVFPTWQQGRDMVIRMKKYDKTGKYRLLSTDAPTLKKYVGKFGINRK